TLVSSSTAERLSIAAQHSCGCDSSPATISSSQSDEAPWPPFETPGSDNSGSIAFFSSAVGSYASRPGGSITSLPAQGREPQKRRIVTSEVMSPGWAKPGPAPGPEQDS